MICTQQCDRIRLFGDRLLLRLFHRAAYYFGLRYLPATCEASQALRCPIVESERGSVSHGGHTITHIITFYDINDGV